MDEIVDAHLSTGASPSVRWWNLSDAEDAARVALDALRWDHLATGSEDEASIRLAREAFATWAFRPRVLLGGGKPVLARGLLGMEAAAPIALAPVGAHALFHPEGEQATVRGAVACGLPAVISQMTSAPFAEIGRTTANWSIQLYPLRDRGLFRAIVDEAIDAGAKGAVLTVDTPVLGRRVRDLRAGFLSGRDSRPWIQDRLDDRGYATFWDAWDGRFDWQAAAELAADLPVPLTLKGILHPADATRAVAIGASGVWVSSHGGRQLDWATAPLAALPEIADAVAGACTVVVDGGIRSGADVAKALCLGADLAAVGRPVIWGLAADGAAGVERVLRLLVDQLENVLALLGAAEPGALSREHLVRV